VALGCLAALVCALAWLVVDHMALDRERERMAECERQMVLVERQADVLGRQVAEQQAAIEVVQRRIAEVRGEMSGWRRLHDESLEQLRSGSSAAAGRARVGGGSTLVVPAEAAANPASLIEALDRLALEVRQEGQNLRTLARLVVRAGRALAALPSRWPVTGAVSSEYGNRPSPWTQAPEFHRGMDLSATMGTPVKASGAGRVVTAQVHGDYGLAVILEHANGLRSLYGHLDKVLVRPGQRVEGGHVIALSGNSGRSTGPHVHYEVLLKGQPVDPRRFALEK
jgi:murein DD-endopeptidase MepM/ murein hydrolase activator NlpD